ncbi:hypothetical protein ABPG77_001356 [Micractinium sp. CCAP 211/92]
MALAAPWEQLAQHADLTAAAAECNDASAAALPAASGERLGRATRAMRLGDWLAAERVLGEEVKERPGGCWLALDLRAACCLQRGRHDLALDDAMQCTKLNPDWARGWARLGAAQLCLGHARAAASAYRQGLSLDGGSREMQLGLKLAQAALAAQGSRRKAMRH